MLYLNIFSRTTTVLGIQLHVQQPAAGILTSTDPSGAAGYSIVLPPTAAFCGLNIYGQWIISDSAAGNGLASTTTGLWMTIGSV